MLTIDPTSVCDVCGDQYGTLCLPYLIPCGHTFCRSCLMYLSERISKGPSCPLCREPFTLEHVHLVRIEPADPLPKLSYKQSNSSDEADSDSSDHAGSEQRIREEAKQLELRVQKAASAKCTFKEISSLRDDIQSWLLAEPRYKPISKFSALRLSAALLRAISGASKASKVTEDGLRDKIKALESQQTTLQADIRRLQQQYGEKPDEYTPSRENPGNATTSLLHSLSVLGPASTAPRVASNPPPLRSSSSIRSPSALDLSSPETGSSSPKTAPSSPETGPFPFPPPLSVITSPTRINAYASTTFPSITSTRSSRTNTRSRPAQNTSHHLRIRREPARSSLVNADAGPNKVSGTADKVIARAKGGEEHKKRNPEKKQSGSGSGSGSGELTYSESRSGLSGSGRDERRTSGPPTSRSSLFFLHSRRHGSMATSTSLTAGRVFDLNEDAELSSDWSDHYPIVSHLSTATLQYPSSKSGLGAGGPAFTRDNPLASSRRHEERRDNREEKRPREDRG